MVIGAAGMDADRQAELLRRRIDRPEEAAPEQDVAHREQQHLDEAPVGRDPLDLGDASLRVVQRHHDRGAQARLAVEQLLRDPVVHGAAQRGAHVLVEQRDRAMQHVADREARAERSSACRRIMSRSPPGRATARANPAAR